MAEQNVFEKIHVDESEKADLGGVLEQLNLPPSVVDFVRKNQRTIYICLGVIAAVVVVWSLYGSYVEKKINESSSALSLALKSDEGAKITSLQEVINNFSGTDAATWAKIEIAQSYSSDSRFDQSLNQYADVRKDVTVKDPLYPLITFGIAQAEEALGNLENALREYTSLQSYIGYEGIGYTGAARIFEVQEKYSEAIRELEKYQGVLIGDNVNSPEKIYIENKIIALKGLM